MSCWETQEWNFYVLLFLIKTANWRNYGKHHSCSVCVCECVCVCVCVCVWLCACVWCCLRCGLTDMSVCERLAQCECPSVIRDGGDGPLLCLPWVIAGGGDDHFISALTHHHTSLS